MGAVILKGGFPEGKGLVERVNGYLETSFLPGRRFASMDDFNGQLTTWLTKANSSIHGTIRCRPSHRIREDLGCMMALPPVLPDVCHRSSLRIGRDHYVRFGSCDYSVHPRAIGRRAELKADLDWVVVSVAGDEVARHTRSLAPHRTITDPAHSRARRALKESATRQQPAPGDIDVEVRDLVTYDHALGVA